MSTSKNDNGHTLRGIGMLDDNAGANYRSDDQIKDEIGRLVTQMLRIYGETGDRHAIEVQVDDGKVILIGELPDRGTRRVVLQAAMDIPSVTSVDGSKLWPESVLD